MLSGQVPCEPWDTTRELSITLEGQHVRGSPFSVCGTHSIQLGLAATPSEAAALAYPWGVATGKVVPLSNRRGSVGGSMVFGWVGRWLCGSAGLKAVSRRQDFVSPTARSLFLEAAISS